MLFLSIAIVISVALITFFGINIEVHNTHQELFEPVKPVELTTDLFDEDGDEKDKEAKQISMDEYIRSINDLMVGDDNE